jgi:N6-adenosine-specific RNA methylase IME4
LLGSIRFPRCRRKLRGDSKEGAAFNWRDRVQRENERVTTSLMKDARIAEERQEFEARRETGATVTDLHHLIAEGRHFAVVYADPPWAFQTYSDKGKQRAPERHYDVMPLDAIKAMPVRDLAGDDVTLLMWATMPRLPDALAVIEAWGFEYKTMAFVWVKQNRSGAGLFTGLGYWTRANAEMCLLATRGAPHRLARDVHQVIMAPVGEHSAKPVETRRRIERLVAGPYIELFARHSEPGWTVWGNEIEIAAAE